MHRVENPNLELLRRLEIGARLKGLVTGQAPEVREDLREKITAIIERPMNNNNESVILLLYHI